MQNGIPKDVSYGINAKNELLKGFELCEKIVGDTVGYRGRTNLIETDGGKATSTLDGYDSLKHIFVENPIQSIAIEVLKEAVEKTVSVAHDGTTTTTILAYAFAKYANDELKKGRSAIEIKMDIEASKDKILKYLKSISIELDDKLIYDVAWTSSNSDDAIAKIVSEAFIKAGENGNVTYQRSQSDDSYLDYINGHLLESGFTDELFINTPSERASFLEFPLIIVSEINFKTVQQVLPFLEYAISLKRPLIIISEMEFHINTVIIKGMLEGKIQAVVIKPPSFGSKRKDTLNDLALLFGTQTISTLSGDSFSGRAQEFIGEAKTSLCNKTDTIFIPSENCPIDKIEGKISELKFQAEKSQNPLEVKYLLDRVSKLSGGVSIIKIGGITPSEVDEKLARVDDAIGAVRSAKENGVVAGGGIALLSASIELDLDVVTKEAIKAPFLRILSNASVKELTISNKYPIGYDVRLFKEVNMFDAGIVDVVKVLNNAVSNAVSVSNTILMTNNVITYKRLYDGN